MHSEYQSTPTTLLNTWFPTISNILWYSGNVRFESLHGGKNLWCGLADCDAVSSRDCLQTFRRNLLSPIINVAFLNTPNTIISYQTRCHSLISTHILLISCLPKTQLFSSKLLHHIIVPIPFLLKSNRISTTLQRPVFHYLNYSNKSNNNNNNNNNNNILL
jgi:hypothetical protein